MVVVVVVVVVGAAATAGGGGGGGGADIPVLMLRGEGEQGGRGGECFVL